MMSSFLSGQNWGTGRHKQSHKCSKKILTFDSLVTCSPRGSVFLLLHTLSLLTRACIWDHKANTDVPLHTYWWPQDLPCRLTLTLIHPLIWFNLLRDSRPFPCSLEKTGQLPNAPYWQPLLWTSSSFLLLNWNLTVPWSHSLLGIRNKGYFSSSTPGLGDGFPVLYASHGGLWNTVCPTPYNFPPKTEFWWSSCHQHVPCLGIYLLNALHC